MGMGDTSGGVFTNFFCAIEDDAAVRKTISRQARFVIGFICKYAIKYKITWQRITAFKCIENSLIFE
jgi:hypothetical protein